MFSLKIHNFTPSIFQLPVLIKSANFFCWSTSDLGNSLPPFVLLTWYSLLLFLVKLSLIALYLCGGAGGGSENKLHPKRLLGRSAGVCLPAEGWAVQHLPALSTFSWSFVLRELWPGPARTSQAVSPMSLVDVCAVWCASGRGHFRLSVRLIHRIWGSKSQ